MCAIAVPVSTSDMSLIVPAGERRQRQLDRRILRVLRTTYGQRKSFQAVMKVSMPSTAAAGPQRGQHDVPEEPAGRAAVDPGRLDQLVADAPGRRTAA